MSAVWPCLDLESRMGNISWPRRALPGIIIAQGQLSLPGLENTGQNCVVWLPYEVLEMAHCYASLCGGVLDPGDHRSLPEVGGEAEGALSSHNVQVP